MNARTPLLLGLGLGFSLLAPAASTTAQAAPPPRGPGTSGAPPPRGERCTSVTSCPQTDRDGDGIPDAWEDALARKFAPEVRLAPEHVDWARPASVPWYLARVSMRFENKGACNRDKQVLAKGQVTQARLATQTAREKNMSWTGCKENGTRHSSSASKRFFLQPGDSAHKGAPRSAWTAYVHVIKSDLGGWDVQYWLFYAYNDSKASFNHEGDWERVTVSVDSRGEFRHANFSQHETSTSYVADELEFVGTHVVAYSADGSHANYPSAGSHPIDGGFGTDDHTYDGGPRWRTWTRFVNVGERARPRAGQEFIRYGGRWGEVGNTQWTSGPTGPATKGAWRETSEPPQKGPRKPTGPGHTPTHTQ